MNRACLAVISVLITVSCGGDKPLPVPTTPTATPVLTSFLIQGPAPTVGPGQMAQLRAVARYSDGSERDVRTDAIWTSSQPQIATVDAGVIAGQALGRVVIRATYMSRSASLTVVVKPEGTFILTGNITEPGPVSVGSATVTVLGGPMNQVTANSFGFYEVFGVSGTVTLRVSKPGYRDETRTLTVTQDQRVDFGIRPISGPTPVAGIYRLTLTISPSCALVPDDQKTRIYTAAIGQEEARLRIQLGDANFVPDRGAEKNIFNGKVVGSTVTFDWGDGYYAFYYGTSVQEILPGGRILGIWGTMVAPAATQTISGTLVGGFTIREGNRTDGCSASDNRVVFTRK
jgi:hypothetical protein